MKWFEIGQKMIKIHQIKLKLVSNQNILLKLTTIEPKFFGIGLKMTKI